MARRRALPPAWAVLLLTGFALLGLPGSALADARDAFKDAMEAVEARDWPRAEQKLRQAVSLDPAANKRTFAKDYLPHYWLGVVLQEQQDCRGAMASWQESQRQGVATGSKDAADMTRRMATCRQALERLEQALGEARGAVAKALQADEALARMSGSAEMAAHWAPYENRRQAALAKLTESERLMGRGEADQSIDPIREAADNASQVTSQLLTIAADARAKAGQVTAASNRAQGDLEEAEASASSALRAVQALEPLPPELSQQAKEVRELLSRIAEVQAKGDPTEMRDLSREVAATIRQLKNMAAPPPTWLTQAAQNFLDQEYSAALVDVEIRLGRPVDGERAADQASRLDPRERFHALLLAAAARHQLWVAAGRSNPADLDQLRADLGEAAALEARATAGNGATLGRASARFLSPALRAMWVEALIEAGLPPSSSAESEP